MSKNFMLDPSNPDFVQQVRQQEAQQLYHQYHFVQQQQHFQYLQNALAKSMNQSPKSPSEQQQQQQQQLQPPYFPTAVFKPNYMQDVLLNESCVLSSPVNSMDSSNCTTTKTTPIMAPINISKHDQLSSISPHGHYHHHEDDDIELFPSAKDGALPSPSSPLIDCSLAKPHEEYLHLVSSLSSTNDMLDTKSNHFCFGYGSPKQTTSNYDF
ncbi:putative zinc finger protein, partial [Candida maltosa Xu316]